jgi:hypothetical protein
MKAMTDKAADRSRANIRLETIRMSELERRHAYAGLRDGELIAELVLRAAADMRAIAHGVEHAAVSLATGIKGIFAKPVKH